MQSAMSQENARDAASGESCVASFLLSPSLSATVQRHLCNLQLVMQLQTFRQESMILDMKG